MEKSVLLEGALDLSALLQSGVYVLLHRERVVYVGKSRMVLKRLYAHRNLWERKRKGLRTLTRSNLKGIPFDQVYFYPCAIEELDSREFELIQRFQPRHNVQLKSPPPPLRREVRLTINGLGFTLNPTSPRLRRPVITEEPLRRLHAP